MTWLRYLHLDVFSDGPFGGHPLIVFLDPCPAPAMAALSHEFGLVVAFPVRTSPGRYRVRIFEHGHELPFGGQPTLGAAWSLGPGTWRQDSLGASVEVVVMADYARMGVPDPVLDPVSDRSLLATVEAVLGVGIDGAYRASCGGNTHLVVPVRADVAGLTVDPGEVARVCEVAGMNTLSPFSWNRARSRSASSRQEWASRKAPPWGRRRPRPRYTPGDRGEPGPTSGYGKATAPDGRASSRSAPSRVT